MGYPERFYSTDGFEWHHLGAFLDGVVYAWRFRPSSRHPDWAKMRARDKTWDYATEEQLDMWRVECAEAVE